MAISNVKKKIAALAELRKDPAAAITKAWEAAKGVIAEHNEQVDDGAYIYDSDVDLIEQILGAVVADIRSEPKTTKADA